MNQIMNENVHTPLRTPLLTPSAKSASGFRRAALGDISNKKPLRSATPGKSLTPGPHQSTTKPNKQKVLFEIPCDFTPNKNKKVSFQPSQHTPKSATIVRSKPFAMPATPGVQDVECSAGRLYEDGEGYSGMDVMGDEVRGVRSALKGGRGGGSVEKRVLENMRREGECEFEGEGDFGIRGMELGDMDLGEDLAACAGIGGVDDIFG